jgi:hypothetical protein
VETISIPPIVTASEGEIENASTELGHWLGSELGVPVYLSSRRNGAGPRTFVRVGDGPDFETPRARPTSSWLRLESGIPTVTYRIAFASRLTGKLDALVAALQADGIRASLDHNGWETEMTIRTHDTEALADARDRVADQAEIQHEQLVGLLPLCMLDGVDVPTLQRLGIAAADTFEYQLIALGNTRSLEAARRQLPAADIASLSEIEIDWTVAPSTAPDLTLAPPRGDLAAASVRR